MSTPTQVIELPADATLTAIQRSLSRSSCQRVLLVLPFGSRALANTARLRLISRQARREGRQVALVTPDPLTQSLARQAGFSVFTSVRRGERTRRWRQLPAELPLPDLSGAREAPPPLRVGYGRSGRAAAMPRRDPPQLPDRGLSRWRKWADALRLVVFLLISLAGLGTLVLFVVPVATVTLVAPRQPLSVTIPIMAAVGIEEADYQAGKVPARIVQTRVEGNGTVPTTGRRDAPADRATGVAVLINRRDSEVQVPELTVVGTSTGVNVRFQITEAVTVPAGIGQTTSARVQALPPGADGNVPAYTINRIEGPLGVALRVINDLPTSGGSVRQVGVVTEVDKDQLRTTLLGEVRETSYLRLGELLREGETVPPESVQTYVIAETFDRFSGEDAEVLGLRLELVARGLAVDTLSARQMVQRALEEQVPVDHRQLGDETAFSIGPMAILDDAKETVRFDVTSTATLVGTVDVYAVRQAIRGLEVAEALRALRTGFELGTDPQVTLRPDWLGQVPWLPYRIRVRVLTG
jgi:hypothetical protein